MSNYYAHKCFIIGMYIFCDNYGKLIINRPESHVELLVM